MSLRHRRETASVSWNEFQKTSTVLQAAHELVGVLPSEKDSAILDIGFGSGWFLAACLKLGYRKLSGADFLIGNKAFVKDWVPNAITLHEIKGNIGTFLEDKAEQFDFIHMSHVIEHIPKYSLLWIVDALYSALKPGGTLLLRTPNMEGPCANSSFYVTLAHEYGFAGSNLVSLLDICGFDEIRFLRFDTYRPTLKQRMGMAIRLPFINGNEFMHRLFGVNSGGQFGAELIVTAKRGDMEPLFDPKYK